MTNPDQTPVIPPKGDTAVLPEVANVAEVKQIGDTAIRAAGYDVLKGFNLQDLGLPADTPVVVPDAAVAAKLIKPKGSTEAQQDRTTSHGIKVFESPED